MHLKDSDGGDAGLTVLIDRRPEFNHAPRGCNVLFMDGHVEFIRYPSTQAPVIKPLAIAMPILTQPQ